MKIFKKIMKFWKRLLIKLLCSRDKHNWEYYTWGSAPVDNLDGTVSIWALSSRECSNCGKHQIRYRKGWDDYKDKITIYDVQ